MAEEIKYFPVHPSCHSWRKSVPWALVEEHEQQAKLNHSQSLKCLARRGGLCPVELYAVIKDTGFKSPSKLNMRQYEIENIIDEWIEVIEWKKV